VVSDEFLPFDDDRFDVVMCIEAFHFAPDPAEGLAELGRVVRPGGTLIVTVPFVWEYDRSQLEHRFTGPEMAQLFEGWDNVQILEDGGFAVSWATITGRIIERGLSRGGGRLAPLGAPLFAAVNAIGMALDRAERRVTVTPTLTLPMNLTVSARKPSGG
jgi:SAM-dependent methyltransferase